MIRLENVSKVYRKQNDDIRALDDVDLSVEKGEFLCVKGPSGSGKSTLLLTMGGMVRPTEGKVLVDGADVYAISGHERAVFRAQNIGFVFQMFHLIPYLTVIENVLVPALAAGRKPDRAEAEALLKRFNMTDRLRHRPSELSTGERQRVAMARALLNKPQLILADEPTGNLDPDNTGEVMGYLTEFHGNGGTVVVVTHEELTAEHANRVVHLKEGRIEAE
ncbi:MAG: ABC transporter ATP-binding protein [Planctomycetes bacterium]|nr:ABC transporter ATP-binding protein [Planctomycetota bacterium]